MSVLLYNGRPIDVDLPNFIESEIVECEPGVKGDTVQGEIASKVRRNCHCSGTFIRGAG